MAEADGMSEMIDGAGKPEAVYVAAVGRMASIEQLLTPIQIDIIAETKRDGAVAAALAGSATTTESFAELFCATYIRIGSHQKGKFNAQKAAAAGLTVSEGNKSATLPEELKQPLSTLAEGYYTAERPTAIDQPELSPLPTDLKDKFRQSFLNSAMIKTHFNKCPQSLERILRKALNFRTVNAALNNNLENINQSIFPAFFQAISTLAQESCASRLPGHQHTKAAIIHQIEDKWLLRNEFKEPLILLIRDCLLNCRENLPDTITENDINVSAEHFFRKARASAAQDSSTLPVVPLNLTNATAEYTLLAMHCADAARRHMLPDKSPPYSQKDRRKFLHCLTTALGGEAVQQAHAETENRKKSFPPAWADSMEAWMTDHPDQQHAYRFMFDTDANDQKKLKPDIRTNVISFAQDCVQSLAANRAPEQTASTAGHAAVQVARSAAGTGGISSYL